MNYYDFAKKNLLTAKLHYENNGDTDEIVVSCQQFFEKSFKQILLQRDGEIYKTHKITFLIKKIRVPEFSMNEDLFRKLQDYCFDKRYPREVYEETTFKEAELFYNLSITLKPIIEIYLEKYSESKSINNSVTFKDL